MITTHQEQHHTASTTARSTPPAARTRPIRPEARAHAARHGDPAHWTAETHGVYAELGGIQ